MFTRWSVAVVAAGLAMAVGGCGGEGGTDGKPDASHHGQAEPTPARSPSKELVSWVGGMCESTTAIKTARKDSTADLKEIRKPPEIGLSAEHLALGYLSRTPPAVEGAERGMKDLDPSGIPAADRVRDAWLKKLKGVVAELDKVSPSEAFDDAEGSAADVDKLIQSLTPPKPDLAALTKQDPQLASAHKRAEQCAPGWRPDEEPASPAPDPTGPLPEAADGKNSDACSDGECEILVTGPVRITANGLTVNISLVSESVTFQTPNSVMQLGGSGGVAEFGDDLKATVVAHNKKGAVLKFTTP